MSNDIEAIAALLVVMIFFLVFIVAVWGAGRD